MSNFNHILDTIVSNNIQDEVKQGSSYETSTSNVLNNTLIDNTQLNPFDIQLFAEELRNLSETKNKAYAELSNTISGYSISMDCIRTTVMKLLNYPVESFANKWLPIIMRGEIGTAIHNMIQSSTKQFTEMECSIKVPSIRFSGRLDALIGNKILVEIKSCSYVDYYKIIKTQQPRISDFFQTVVYKYVLENHLEELKNPGVPTRTPPPRLDKYDIDTIQFIYVAHDISAADIEDFGACLEVIKKIKKHLNSKSDSFYFMTNLILDTKCFDINPYYEYIINKIKAINHYVDTETLPPENDPFIDKKKCYFCLYKSICDIANK